MTLNSKVVYCISMRSVPATFDEPALISLKVYHTPSFWTHRYTPKIIFLTVQTVQESETQTKLKY